MPERAPRSDFLRQVRLPELFLGLLALAIAIVLTARTFAQTIEDTKKVSDRVTVTGSARRPIESDLANWTLQVTREARTKAEAAQGLKNDVRGVRQFLLEGGLEPGEVSLGVVSSETLQVRLKDKSIRTTFLVSQDLSVSSKNLTTVGDLSTRIGDLLARGIDVSGGDPAYVVTRLERAKIKALELATEDARSRAETLVGGLGGRLGRLRASSLGVYQITPRFSTDVADYGINDTSSPEKDIRAVVTATFDVN